jgi:16S rRNA (uracil1498-N3)-methyltransferase
MPRFFVQSSAIYGDSISIVGSDASHICRSLRMKVGDTLTVCDMQRTEYACRIDSISPDAVLAHILSKTESQNEPPYRATLYMALPKGDKMEYIIQKAVEMGVWRIVPYRSERSVVKLDVANGAKKAQRWQKIADAAAEQCGRGILPTVCEPVDFAQAIEMAKEDALAFVCYEDEQSLSLPCLLQNQKAVPETVGFFVGAEGGIAKAELDAFRAAGISSVGLGKRILRCESAPLFVLSCLSYTWEI